MIENALQSTKQIEEETARLLRLRSLAVLDSEPEAIFEQITRLAADLCGVPIALITLVDADRQWFKSNIGLPAVPETPREVAFCSHAILSDSLMEVPDALLDPRFVCNPLVTGEPDIRFYAGAPLGMMEGERVGTLCVIDREPRQLTALQRTALTGLARLAVTALLEREQRLAAADKLTAAETNYRLIVEGQTELVSLADEAGRLNFVNAAYAQFFGLQPNDMIGRPLTDFVADADRSAVLKHLHRVLETRIVAADINRMVSADGRERWVAWTNRCVPSADGRGFAVHSVGRDISRQRSAEQALAESERNSRRLYEATPTMLHSIDADGRLLDVSDVWLSKLGYERSEVIGRLSSEFLAPDSQRRARDTVLPAFFATGRCNDVDYRMLRHDGSLLDVRLSAVLERDSEGNATRSLAVMVDMTEKLAADAALDETSHMLQLVVDNLPARISYWDRQSRNRFANKAFLDWFGMTHDSIGGAHVGDVVGQQWFARIKPHLDAGLAGVSGQMETVATLADGLDQVMDVRFAPDFHQGQAQGLIVFALDITQRREAERELVEQEQRFKLLVEGVRDYAMYMLDPQGRVTTWNAGAERNKGYTADQVLRQPFGLFFVPEDRLSGKPEQELALAARDGRFVTEAWRVRGDGSRFWAGVSLTAIHDERRRLVGYAKITRDLTEQRRQQNEIERALAEKETLLKEVYHRVKNNLQVVQSLLTLQRQALSDGPARAALQDSVQRVRAMALVHEKLYQSGNLAAVSLDIYTRDLMRQISETHGAAELRITLHADIADVETGLDSAVPFGLLLTELLTNCFKHAFLGRRSGEIRVRLVRREDGDLLTVADDGIGFAAGFEPGAHMASMGFQVAHGLARQLGGELQARSEGGAVLSAVLTRL